MRLFCCSNCRCWACVLYICVATAACDWLFLRQRRRKIIYALGLFKSADFQTLFVPSVLRPDSTQITLQNAPMRSQTASFQQH